MADRDREWTVLREATATLTGDESARIRAAFNQARDALRDGATYNQRLDAMDALESLRVSGGPLMRWHAVIAAVLAERDAARQALEMLWAHYLLPISDEQKAQVRAALVAVPDTEKGAEQAARSAQDADARADAEAWLEHFRESANPQTAAERWDYLDQAAVHIEALLTARSDRSVIGRASKTETSSSGGGGHG